MSACTNKVCIRVQSHPFIYILSIAAFTLWQSYVAMTENAWPTKVKTSMERRAIEIWQHRYKSAQSWGNKNSHSCLTRYQHWIYLDVQILLSTIAAEELLRKITSPPWIFTAINSKWGIFTNSYLFLQPQVLCSSCSKFLSVYKNVLYSLYWGFFFQSSHNWLKMVDWFLFISWKLLKHMNAWVLLQN